MAHSTWTKFNQSNWLENVLALCNFEWGQWLKSKYSASNREGVENKGATLQEDRFSIVKCTQNPRNLNLTHTFSVIQKRTKIATLKCFGLQGTFELSKVKVYREWPEGHEIQGTECNTVVNFWRKCSGKHFWFELAQGFRFQSLDSVLGRVLSYALLVSLI